MEHFKDMRAVTHATLQSHRAAACSLAKAAATVSYWGGHVGMCVLLWEMCSSCWVYAWQEFAHTPSLPAQLQRFIQAAIWMAAHWIPIWFICCVNQVMHISLVFAIYQYVNVLSQNRDKPNSHFIQPSRFLGIKL